MRAPSEAFAIGLLILCWGGTAQAASRLTVEAVNRLPIARTSQTIEVPAQELEGLRELDLRKIQVHDPAGLPVLCQAVDTDFDAYRRPDMVVFQSDLAAGEAKRFTLEVGPKQVYTRDQFKAHGRFVRERFDDFAWENDRIAHRMYGKGLEAWAGEPLTSSTVDIWSKRVPQMVIDEWYMVDNYHADTGQGADFYSAGPSRGCGGNGLWAGEKLWVSRNFVDSRVLANGPIRLVFELVYEPFEVDGQKVAEVKRITLDAGSQLNLFQSFYTVQGEEHPLISGVGLKKQPGQQKASNLERGWVALWEKVAKNQGMQGLGIVASPEIIVRETEDQLNHLLLLKTGADHRVAYRGGFVWDKSGHFTEFDAWQKHLDQVAQEISSPIEVRVLDQ